MPTQRPTQLVALGVAVLFHGAMVSPRGHSCQVGTASGYDRRQIRALVCTDYYGVAEPMGVETVLDASAPVPCRLEHPRFVAMPLTRDTAALDYAAYMASPEVIRLHSDGRWPVAGFTFADDLELVARHEADHASRRAFAFVLLAPSHAEALGCLYLNPLPEYLRRVQADPQLVDAIPPASAMVTFWLRRDQQQTGLVEAVAEAVNDWLLTEWPLVMHLFRILPGERSSRRALERLDLRRVELTLPGEERPYLWYAPSDWPDPSARSPSE